MRAPNFHFLHLNQMQMVQTKNLYHNKHQLNYDNSSSSKSNAQSDAGMLHKKSPKKSRSNNLYKEGKVKDDNEEVTLMKTLLLQTTFTKRKLLNNPRKSLSGKVPQKK